MLVHKCTGFEQTFEDSNLQMFNATFKLFIPHYITEYVENLCSPYLLREQPKGEFIIVSHTRLLYVCFMALFAGNFSACIITNNE